MTDNLPYPRVLVVGQSFDLSTGGGITASNLFSGWPKDHLASLSDIKFLPNWQVCNQFYRLGHREYQYAWPMSVLFHHRRESGPLENIEPSENDAKKLNWQQATGHSRKSNTFWKMVYAFDDWSGIEHLVRRITFSRELLNWLDQFQPEIVYTQAASIEVMKIVQNLLARYDVPLAVHIMDDWPTTLYKGKLFSPYLRWHALRLFQDILRKSVLTMGISEKMCRVYEERYQRPFEAFHNPIDISVWLAASRKQWEVAHSFQILYAGRIGTANRQGIVDCCKAVAELHALHLPVRLDVFTPDWESDFAQSIAVENVVEIHPPKQHREMPATLSQADALLLPLDFDKDSIKFAQFSMPTKTSEYMASGVPILVYAPRELAMTEYALNYGWGLVVSERNPHALKGAITRLFHEQSLREQLAVKAQSIAIKNHDAAMVRERFRVSIQNAINSTN